MGAVVEAVSLCVVHHFKGTMNFVDRFKNRAVVSPTVFVDVEPLRLEIARFAQAEMVAARLKMNENLRLQGLEPEEATKEQRTIALCIELPFYIKRHIKGWKPIREGDQVPPYSRANADQLIDEMTEDERISLSAGFTAAVLLPDPEAEKKGKSRKDSRPSGSDSSADESGTTSNPQKQPADNARD